MPPRVRRDVLALLAQSWDGSVHIDVVGTQRDLTASQNHHLVPTGFLDLGLVFGAGLKSLKWC